MANPPITIPPFTNVPAPGSPVRSNWPQELTQYVVDNFTQAGAGAYAFDAAGNTSIGFPVAFRTATTPVVVVCGAWQGAQEMLYSVSSVTRTGFFVRVYNTNVNAVPAAGQYTIAWHAFGKR